MIEYVNQLGPGAPRIGPPPSGTAASVWSLDTTAGTVGGYRVEEADAVLDAGEREKAARLVLPGLRHRYLASHLGLRVLLGARLGLDPREVTLVREDCPCCGGPHGRPAVAGGGVHFSLSHSGDLAYLAFAAVPVGVDIEETPGADAVADVLDSLHPAETAELTALAPPRRPAALARVWSRKEACLKAAGTGLALGTAEPYVGSATAPAPVTGWILTDLPAPDGYAAALAVADHHHEQGNPA
ncbi:4'-phosphopantetheinyl transferase family protein [Streptomyces xanthophaeus]|uniref:4'-phosphopantetheinyl transferase family protein n=1 Tax=Streptomyces xanthophaeus TaxID=67385 RepID=UPI0026470FCF|nr:4'-phosphopantetheinyl transferase superfamily protein [Streptomyces xanthophaeus]WKD36969.1 4'-phosphopantetheinyl transferase superfamily protein [Streptomyces xanthophaeus]